MFSKFLTLFETPPKLCCSIETLDGEIKGYVFGTCHFPFLMPVQLEKKIQDGSIKRVVVENEQLPSEEEKNPTLDQRILLEAKTIGLPVTILDREIEKDLVNKAATFAFFNPTFQAIFLQKTMSSLLSIYMSQNLKKLESISSNISNENVITQRNKDWGPDILENLKKGGTLIAVGFAHLYGQEGLFNFLKTNGYVLKNFPVTISCPFSIKNDLPKELNDRIYKAILNSSNYKLSRTLSELAEAYHQKKSTQQENKQLDETITMLTMSTEEYMKSLKNLSITTNNHNDLKQLNAYQENPLHGFEFLVSNEKLTNQNEKYFIQENFTNFVNFFIRENHVSDPQGALNAYEIIIKLTFYCYLFYPVLIKELFNQYIEHFLQSPERNKYSSSQMQMTKNDIKLIIRIFLLCGVSLDICNSKHYAYATLCEPNYFINTQKTISQPILHRFFNQPSEGLSEIKNKNHDKAILNTIYEYLDDTSQITNKTM